MKEKILAPIKETPEDYEELERRIGRLFKKEIYLPLLESIGANKDIIKNATEDILDAIRSGRIYFYRGEFKGRFNAAVSRELHRIGAKFDRRQGTFKIGLGSIPAEIKTAISVAETRFTQLAKKLDERLAQILPEEITDRLKIDDVLDSAVWKVEKAVQKSIKGLTVTPTLTKEQREKLVKEYAENLKLDIKKWTDEEVLKLRKSVMKSAMAGNRYEAMVKKIERSYNVSQGKAKFLARQETSLMMSKLKETRYLDAGVNEYIWGCVVGSPAHPVRPMHKKLEGKRFSWNNPPIVDENGNRKNPGQDYNCRCFPRPVVRF